MEPIPIFRGLWESHALPDLTGSSSITTATVKRNNRPVQEFTDRIRVSVKSGHHENRVVIRGAISVF